MFSWFLESFFWNLLDRIEFLLYNDDIIEIVFA